MWRAALSCRWGQGVSLHLWWVWDYEDCYVVFGRNLVMSVGGLYLATDLGRKFVIQWVRGSAVSLVLRGVSVRGSVLVVT